MNARARWLRALAGAAWLALGACGGDEPRTARPVPPGAGASAGGSTGATPGPGGGGQGGSASAGPGSGGGEVETIDDELGNVPVSVIPDTRCAPFRGAATEVYAAGAPPPSFDRLEVLGSGFLAGGALAGGAVTFAGDGSGASLAPIKVAPNFNLSASEGGSFGLVGAGGGIVYRRYDEHGAPLGAPLELSSAAPVSMAVAGAAGVALVAWGESGAVRARGVNASGAPAGQAFDLATNAYGDVLFLAAAGAPSGTFAVTWTGNPASSIHRTMLARATPTGAIGEPVEIVRTTNPHRINRIVARSGGWAILLTGGAPFYVPYVVLLDEAGAVVGQAASLAGAYHGWDLAERDDKIGVVASRADGQPEFRALDAELAPLGPWTCLASAGSIDIPVAVAAEAGGFAVLFRTAAGATALARF